MKETPAELRRLRRRIDTIDRRVLGALADRFQVVKQIGELKQKMKMDTYQASRWEELLAARLTQAGKLGLDDSFTKAFFHLIHEEALSVQRGIVAKARRRGRAS
jgi:chorismate mutase